MAGSEHEIWLPMCVCGLRVGFVCAAAAAQLDFYARPSASAHLPLALPTRLSIEQQEEVDAPQIDGADKCIMQAVGERERESGAEICGMCAVWPK